MIFSVDWVQKINGLILIIKIILSLVLSFIHFLGETVVQYKFTVLVTATGPARITGLPFEEDIYVSNLTIKDPEVLVCFK